MTKLILASGSPRRAILLRLISNDFVVIVPDVDETLPEGSVIPGLEAIAARKAGAVNVIGDAVVLAADTCVVLDDEVLGKPDDAKHARHMLNNLNARVHKVVTAIAVRSATKTSTFHVSSQVRIMLTGPETDAYIESGQWEGKAGAYGIQDATIAESLKLDGSWSNVVGLPLHEVHDALAALGVPVQAPPSEESLQLQNPF
jgi:septum formation protein